MASVQHKGAHRGFSWQILGGGHGGSPEAESLLIIFKQKRGQNVRIHFHFKLFKVIARPRLRGRLLLAAMNRPLFYVGRLIRPCITLLQHVYSVYR